MLVTHRPHPTLAPFVESIWFASRAALAHNRERSLPTGRVDIVIPLLQDSLVRFDSVSASHAVHYRGGIVSGAHDRFVVRGMAGASAVIGVHFRPGGAAPFFAGALSALHNRTELLDALWGPAAAALRERLQHAPTLAQRFRLVEDALLAHGPTAYPLDGRVLQAVQMLGRDPSVARVDSVQRASGYSPQQFIRRFDSLVGITPKRFARVLRFNALLRRVVRVGPRDWAALAAEGGYYDQSHLIHEFRLLAGITPARYVPAQSDQPSHVPLPELQRL